MVKPSEVGERGDWSGPADCDFVVLVASSEDDLGDSYRSLDCDLVLLVVRRNKFRRTTRSG